MLAHAASERSKSGGESGGEKTEAKKRGEKGEEGRAQSFWRATQSGPDEWEGRGEKHKEQEEERGWAEGWGARGGSSNAAR